MVSDKDLLNLSAAGTLAFGAAGLVTPKVVCKLMHGAEKEDQPVSRHFGLVAVTLGAVTLLAPGESKKTLQVHAASWLGCGEQQFANARPSGAYLRHINSACLSMISVGSADLHPCADSESMLTQMLTCASPLRPAPPLLAGVLQTIDIHRGVQKKDKINLGNAAVSFGVGALLLAKGLQKKNQP